MNIAVCDDNSNDRDKLINLLKLYFSNKSISYTIFQFENGTDLLYEFEEGAYYDLIILDIYMEKILGIDVARKLRKMNYDGDIVFLTATSKFAVASYEVGASGYLLKPHSFDKLCIALDRILKHFSTNVYQIRRRNNEVRIPYNEITYIESNNSKCTMHCIDGEEYVIYKHLSEIEETLSDERFLRCHRSYIVNMNYIARVEKQFILSNGDSVLIRQKSLKEIRQTYFDYRSHESK